jgi:hypothetical protein
MSHFSVAVFTKPNGKTVDELLAPYDENLEVEPYVAKTREEALTEIAQYEDKYPELKTKTDEEKMSYWFGYNLFDESGNPMTTYNQNSKWDWYSVGGRFPGKLKAKSGNHGEGSSFHDNPMIDGEFDSARVGDIDFSLDMDTYNNAIRYWEVVVEKQPLKEGEKEDDFFSLYREGYYKEYYKDKETYAKICASCNTYAVVTPDGEWHEKGQMGWFGMSSETGEEALDWELHYKERFIDTADPDWILTIVDCHI